MSTDITLNWIMPITQYLVNLTLDIETCHDIISQINGLELGQNNIILKSRWYDVFTEYITMIPKSLWSRITYNVFALFHKISSTHSKVLILILLADFCGIAENRNLQNLSQCGLVFKFEDKLPISGIVLRNTFWNPTT